MTRIFVISLLMALTSCQEKKGFIHFINKVEGKLPVEFHPLQQFEKMETGKEKEITYRIVNISPESVQIKIAFQENNQIEPNILQALFLVGPKGQKDFKVNYRVKETLPDQELRMTYILSKPNLDPNEH